MKDTTKAFLHACMFVALATELSQAQTPSTVSYQGRIQVSGTNFSGGGQLKFAIISGSTSATFWSNDGTSTAGSEPASAVTASVQEGLVMVMLGDTNLVNMTSISPDVFAIPDSYLRIWFNDGVQGFAQLAPDQPLASVPYAMTVARVPASAIANQSIVTDKLALDAVTSGKIADGTITAADVNVLSLGTLFWKLDGNVGTTPGPNFVGTTDNQALEFKVNGARALRLEPGAAVNVIGGGPNNVVAPGVVGVTIAGGTVQSVTSNYSTIAGGQSNSVTEVYGTIGGGAMNRAGGGLASTVAGGFSNSAIGPYASIGGGRLNTVLGFVAGVSGGQGNLIETNADHSVIGGGLNNLIGRSTFRAVVGGGGGNRIGMDCDFSTISGGLDNLVASNSLYSTIGGGQTNRVATNSPYAFIGAGFNNSIAPNASYTTIGGGSGNDIGTNSDYTVIGGGNNNNIGADSGQSTIAGGAFNDIGTNAGNAAILGGNNNNIAANASYSTIGGGAGHNIDGDGIYGAIVGGQGNRIVTNSPAGFVGGGQFNIIGANTDSGAIVGGSGNRVGTNCDYSIVGGGFSNRVGDDSEAGTIGGGYINNIGTNCGRSTIGGGFRNTISAESIYSTIAGGSFNVIGTNSDQCVIGGGGSNTIATNSSFATIPGGDSNFATNRAFAAGTRAKANNSGAFVWGDSQSVDIASTNANSVTMRATGGYRLFSGIAPTAGVYLAPGGGGWVALSDRNAKENFESVDSRVVLEKVAALPVTTWNYKSQSADIRHIGPVAQDFKAAFGVGETETGITTIDADGVALAAIQGLNKKLEEQLKARDAEIQALKEAMAELKARLGSAP